MGKDDLYRSSGSQGGSDDLFAEDAARTDTEISDLLNSLRSETSYSGGYSFDPDGILAGGSFGMGDPDYGTIDSTDEYADENDTGYDDGYNGYDDDNGSYDDGYDDSYDDSYDDGYDDSYDDGYDNSYDDSYGSDTDYYYDTDAGYDNSDTYQDSGEYRSFNGNREYRSFDAGAPDLPPDEWYRYSDTDQELDDTAPEKPAKKPRKKKHHPVCSAIAHGLLIFCTVFSIVYLIALYSGNSVISSLRTMYIQTAMTTLNHKWLATTIIPSNIIDDVMRLQYEAEDSSTGVESSWGIDVVELPSFISDTVTSGGDTAESGEGESQTTGSVSNDNSGSTGTQVQTDEDIFYELFWEIDRDSFEAYLNDHPDTLANGWSGININEAGLDDDGTSIQTIYGDQVLAINAVDGVMLARVYLSSNNSRGVLAICKDTSRLSCCAASTIGTIGQVAGKIADANNGILAITANGFDDPEGNGNGGDIQGIAVCNGVTYGTRLGAGYKRLELRTDNKMYIVDSNSSIDSTTRDAAEFQPALIVDGATMDYGIYTSPNPRTALGQTSRLETIMIVVEGRLTDSLGCSVDYVAEKMLQYGCVQAINLDGGTSAIMYYDGEYVTRCSNTALPSGRSLPNAWVYAYAD